jgi:hypothetical protein
MVDIIEGINYKAIIFCSSLKANVIIGSSSANMILGLCHFAVLPLFYNDFIKQHFPNFLIGNICKVTEEFIVSESIYNIGKIFSNMVFLNKY